MSTRTSAPNGDSEDGFDRAGKGPALGRGGVERDRYGRAMIPEDPHDPTSWRHNRTPHTSVTTLAGTLEDTYTLGQWQQRMVARGLALRPDLYALAASLDPKEDRAEYQRLCEDAISAAGARAGANLGTALHAFTRQLDDGADADAVLRTVPTDLREDVEAYASGLAGYGISILPGMTERHVQIRPIGASGTFDKIGFCHDWDHPRIMDTKTAQDIELGQLKTAMQLAMYANANHIWNQSSCTYEIMPEVDSTSAVVLWLPSNGKRLEIMEIDNLAEAWARAQEAVSVRAARKLKWLKPARPPASRTSAREAVYGPRDGATGADPWLARIAQSATKQALSALRREGLACGEWTSRRHSAALARMAEIER